jgi:hypothetical protein
MGVDRAAGGAQARGQQPARRLDRYRDRVPGAIAGLGEAVMPYLIPNVGAGALL